MPEGEEQHPIWRAVLEEFRETMTPTNAARCARAHVVDQEGTVLRLAVPDTFHLHWLERLHGRIEETLALLGHAVVRVTFQVAAHDSAGAGTVEHCVSPVSGAGRIGEAETPRPLHGRESTRLYQERTAAR